MKKLCVFLFVLLSINLNSTGVDDPMKFRKVYVEPIETIELPDRIESVTVVGGLPVIDIIGNSLEAAIQIAAETIEIIGKTRKTIQGYIEEGTSAVKDIKEVWYESLEVVNQFVSDYNAIESIVNQTANIISDSYKFLNDIQSYEYVKNELTKIGIKQIESELKKNKNYVDDLEAVLNSGKLTDAERLNVIDKIESKVALCAKDVTNISTKMKSMNDLNKGKRDSKDVFDSFFGE